MFFQFLGATVAIGSLIYFAYILGDFVVGTELDIDMASEPLQPKHFLDDESKYMHLQTEPDTNGTNGSQNDPQTILAQQLTKIRSDYYKTPPIKSALMGTDPFYVSDFNDYQFINKDA